MALAPFAVPGRRGCFDFPAVRSMAPTELFLTSDENPGAKQIVAPPGSAVPPASALDPKMPCPPGRDPAATCMCTSFAGGQSANCSAFFYAGLCYCIGSTVLPHTVALLDLDNATAGVSIYFGGGVGGSGCASRGIRYDMVCDLSAPAGAGPTTVVEHQPANCDITVTWPTATACQVVTSNSCPVPPLSLIHI